MPTSNEDQWTLAGTQALQQTQAEQIRSSVSQALPTNPDQEAQTRRYAAAAQVPLDTARALPDVVKQQAQMSTFDASVLARQFPTTAQYLIDPDNARLVHDDIPGTANVEQAIKALPKPAPAVNLMPPAEPVEPDKSILDTIGDNFKSLVSAPGANSAPAALIKGLGGSFNKAAGAVNVVAGAVPTLYDKAASLISGKTDTSASDWWFKNMVDQRVAAAPVFEPSKNATFTEKAFHTTGNLLGMLSQITLTGGGGEAGVVTDAMSAAVVLGTRAAHGVKSMMFPALADAVDTGRRVYQETGDGAAAARAAQMQYATSTMAGVVPLSAPGTAAVRAATGFVSGVSLGEVSRTLMNTVMPDSMQTPYSGEELILSGLAGSVMGRVMGPQAEPAYHEAARRTYVEAAQFEAAQKGADSLHALGQISAASKLRERDPAAFKAFVDSVTEDGHLQDVFVDARELTNALNQSGMSDADLAAKMPDVAAQLKEARETNGDVRIPVADYATHIAGGPVDEAILQHLKTDPEGKTYSEAQTFYQTQVESLKAEVQKIVDDHANGEQIKASRDGIRDKILAQLTEVNRFTPQVNQHYADMHADYYTAMASRAGMTPEQFMDTYKLGVTGSLGSGANRFDQDGALGINSQGFKAWSHDIPITESNFSTGSPAVVSGYHGTSSDVTEFSSEASGSTTRARDTFGAFFFGAHARTANFYADFAGKNNRNQQKFEALEVTKGYLADAEEQGIGWKIDIMKKEVENLQSQLAGVTAAGPNIMPVYLRMENPLVSRQKRTETKSSDLVNTLIKQAKEEGRDGIILENTFDREERFIGERFLLRDRVYIVFDPTQIKSATGNNGEFNPNDPNILHQSAYHGTPHDFVRFSIDKIGTGEGNQAYGHGLYFAESKDIAKEYQRNVTAGTAQAPVRSFKGEVLTPGTPEYHAATLMASPGRTLAAVRREVAGWLKDARPDEVDHYQGVLDALNRADKKSDFKESAPKGKLYQVDIPDEHVANFLHWDRPLADQPKAMESIRELLLSDKVEQRALDDFGVDTREELAAQLLDSGSSGADVYGSLTDVFRTDKAASAALDSVGVKGIKYLDGTSRGKGEGTHNLVVFDDKIVTLTHKDGSKVSPDERREYMQSAESKPQEARGQIAFADDITRQASVMSLLKKADLSTFVHESGHFFLEVQSDLARKIEARIAAGEEVSPGERGILGDMHTILDWMGIKGTPDVSAPQQWGEMSLEEKRDSHEQFARGFEAYALEGKSPSVGLTKAFQAFRSWLLHVYKQMTALKVELTPEVRSVFDRMLATDDAIKTAEQVRGYRPLFESAADAGMTPEDFATYQDLGKEATADAADQLQARSLRDMKWMANAKSKAMKALQKEAASKRKEVRQQVTAEVMSQPVYQAWQFLTLRGDKSTQALPEAKENFDKTRVDPTVDNLFTAIAKHGGLDRDEVKAKWGADHRDMPDSGVFGKPILRKSGGLSLERMAEQLVQDHYLDAHDLAEFEMKFDRQADGQDQRSWQFDYSKGDKPAEGVDTSINYHGKLDLVELKRMFGDDSEVVRKLVEQRMTSAKAGLDPDIVAATVGHFESGRELIEQLFAAETPHKVIEGMTDQRMLEQHGDLIDAQSIERAAEAAIHNEARARFVASELRALASASDVRADNGTNKKGHRMTTSALAAAAKEAADAGIAAKRVRDIRPAQYAAAEARAAKMAEKALIGGDLPAAAVEKRAQLLNNRLVKAATEAIEEIRKGVQYLGKFDKAGVRANIDLEYRDQIDSLLDRYDLRKSTTNTALDKREALLTFVERMAEQGYEPQIPERLLNEANRSHFKDLTVEEFRGLVDAVKSIEHLGRLKTRLLDLKEMRELQALADEAVATTGALPQRDAESNRGLTSMEQKWLNVKSAGRSMQAALLKMEQMFDWLDGRNPNGVFNRVVFRRIADAGSNEANMQADIKRKIDALLHTHLADVTKEKGKIYTAPGLIDGLTGKPQKFTKKEMLALAGNMGNESNTTKLVNGEKWNETAVWDFLHKNMTKADWDFVAGLGKTLETLWPEKLAMSRRLGNTNPDKIAPRPFDTPHGHYEGWYWPMVYDPARAQDVAERGARAGDSLFENIYSRANTDTGRMHTRNENYARPLLLSLDTIPRVIKDEIHDIAYREAIIDADKFLSHKDVREAITNALSPEHYAQLKPWLQSIANDRKVDMAALKWFDQLAHGLRTRATIVGLGYRVSTMLVHGSSAAMESIAELGPTWMAKGLADFANPMQWSANRDFIFERSGEMRNRTNEVDRDVREHLREIELRLMDTTTGMAARGADMMKARAYQGIAMLDMASALPTWMGAYHRGMATEANGGHGMSEADAVYFADKTVRNAHGGSGAKDLAAVQRGPEFFKLFSMFYTFWNHNVNRLMDTARMAKSLPETYRTGEPGEFKGDLGLVVMRTLIYTLGVQAMHGMLHPSKDDEGETSWFAWAAKEFGAAAFAGIPVIRDVAAHYITGKDYSPTPAAGIVDAIGASGMDAMNLMTGQEANPKALKHTITTAGYVFGLPLGQPASVAQFLWNVTQGQDHPETAGDWLRGVMHGESKQH